MVEGEGVDDEMEMVSIFLDDDETKRYCFFYSTGIIAPVGKGTWEMLKGYFGIEREGMAQF